jgi:hypothetical protein
MDSYASGGIGASVVVALGIAYKVFSAVNHHRLVSRCCGKVLEASIDVDETTPKDKKPDTVVDVSRGEGSLSPRSNSKETS